MEPAYKYSTETRVTTRHLLRLSPLRLQELLQYALLGNTPVPAPEWLQELMRERLTIPQAVEVYCTADEPNTPLDSMDCVYLIWETSNVLSTPVE